MNDNTDQVRRTFRNNVPLICGIVLSALLFIYLILPGIVIGLLVRVEILDPNGRSSSGREGFNIVFCVPILLSEHIKPLGRFYDWQFYLVSGYDDR